MLIYVIITILIFVIRNKYRNKDTFVNYKKVVVTPSPIIYNNYVLYGIKEYPIYKYLLESIKNIYPISKINYNSNCMQNLRTTDNNVNHISCIQDICYQHYNSNNNNHNIRFICSIAIESITLLTSIYSKIFSWNDLYGKNIGTLSKNSGSYLTLMDINNNFNLNLNIIVINTKGIKSALSNNLIDAFFIITSHPSKILHDIHRVYPLRFIGTSGLSNKIIQKIFPYYIPSTIDLTNYKIYHSLPETFNSRVNIIANKDMAPNHGYKFIYTIFKNILNIKNKGSDDFKLQMMDFKPEYLYLSNPDYKLQKGVYLYYRKNGMITNNNSLDCMYTSGVNHCNIKKINKYRLL